ncbi:MAG TPA: division/cell wall cluster transcriptional repressor MraZ [Armatimonadota bacterium]
MADETLPDFSGARGHTVDAKGRTILPSEFRKSLGEAVFLTRGPGGCLWLFTREEWAVFVRKLSSDSMVNPDVLALQRFFIGSASELHFDDQGRIAIPQLLRDYAQIGKDIVTAGMGKKLELWSKPKWDSVLDELTPDVIHQLGTRISL